MSLSVLSGIAASLLSLTVAGSSPSKSPPAPPGPARPAAKRVVIAPAPDAPGSYLMQEPGARTLFHESGVTMRLNTPSHSSRELRWGVAGASAVQPQPLQPREAKFHQYLGPRESWKTNLPTWGALYYPGVIPGVDLWLEARDHGMAYSLRAEHGANLRQVRLEWRGAQALRIAEGGRALEVRVADGLLREVGLRCGQERTGGTSLDLPCRYREVRPKGPDLWEYVIEVDVKEPRAPAWVDPGVEWSTFLGGQGDDSVEGLSINDPMGDVFVVGSSGSAGLEPIGARGNATNRLGGKSEVFVSRYRGDGTPVWTAVFGGTQDDFARALAIGMNSDLFVAGTTSSSDFPNMTGGAIQGATDGFVARLGSTTGVLDWVQRLGGTEDEDLYSLVEGKDGKVYVAGSTDSLRGPTSDAGVSKGKRDLFVSKFDGLSGTLERTLILSGSANEEALSITKDPAATLAPDLFVTGYTESPDFPLSSPANPPMDLDGGREAVVLKLPPDLSGLTWGTFIGGHGQDEGRAIQHVTSNRLLVVVGTTHSSDFPNMGHPVPQKANAFAVILNPASGATNLSVVAGGSGDDEGLALASGSYDTFYIGGKTDSKDLPASLGFDKKLEGTEGFVLRMAFDAGTYSPEWGTYVGGSADDEVRALASSSNDDLVIGGVTRSSDIFDGLPESGDDPFYSAAKDGFAISMDAHDPTPPVGTVLDGIGKDRPSQDFTNIVQASWLITDNESGIMGYEVGFGTAPGCTDFLAFRNVSQNKSFELDLPAAGLPSLTPGTWYFATVRATNVDGLSSTLSSDGVFVLFPDGGPNPQPPAPPPGTLCPGQQPDGGTPSVDGGTDGGPDAGPGPGPTDDGGVQPEPGDRVSPVGWGCGATGGPTALVLLLLVGLGLWGSRRKAGAER